VPKTREARWTCQGEEEEERIYEFFSGQARKQSLSAPQTLLHLSLVSLSQSTTSLPPCMVQVATIKGCSPNARVQQRSYPIPANECIATRFGSAFQCSSQRVAHLGLAKGVLARVCDVQKSVLILVLFVDAAHEGSSGREDFIDEDEDGLFGAELDALANNIDELADGEICGDQVLLLVDGSDVGFFNLLTDDRDAVGVLLTNAFGFCLALLERVFVLEFGTHNGGI